MNLLIGVIFIALGVVVIKYRYQIYDFTGEWGWATKYLGGNGTIVALVLAGMFFIGLGTVYPFGVVKLNSQPIQQVQISPNASR